MNYANDWEAVREAVQIRDRDRCINCGIEGEDVTLDVHHIVPRGQGGSNKMSNLALLCRRCHDAAHRKKMAPTVDFQSTGKMKDEEFELYRNFFEKLPSARFDSDEHAWRVPVADVEWLLESMSELQRQSHNGKVTESE